MGPVETGSESVDERAVESWTAWEPDRLIAGRYRLLRPLGSGGSAHVWAALDESLGREVAIKSLSGLSIQGGHERERLEREAHLLATLHHPQITTVFDFAETVGPDGTGHPFLVAELLDGESLSARLKRGPLEPSEALTVCTQVADALATAHGSGVVHRDVKPGNVMLTSRGAVLLDFGISRRDTDADLTGQVVIGTPACMAPEQWRGRAARPASDVYALGCLLYWCLTDHAPFAQRELPALGMAHLLADPPPLPLTGRQYAQVNQVYRACMRKDPDDRPSAREVAAALDPAADRLSQTTTVAMNRPRHRVRLAASFAAVGAALAAGIALPLTQTDVSATTTPASTVQSSVSSNPSTSHSSASHSSSASQVSLSHPSTSNPATAPNHIVAANPKTSAADATHAGPAGKGDHHGHGKHGDS